jgi:hypothetical protein
MPIDADRYARLRHAAPDGRVLVGIGLSSSSCGSQRVNGSAWKERCSRAGAGHVHSLRRALG